MRNSQFVKQSRSQSIMQYLQQTSYLVNRNVMFIQIFLSLHKSLKPLQTKDLRHKLDPRLPVYRVYIDIGRGLKHYKRDRK